MTSAERAEANRKLCVEIEQSTIDALDHLADVAHEMFRDGEDNRGSLMGLLGAFSSVRAARLDLQELRENMEEAAKGAVSP